uniref:CAZy families GH32 protein n=1 Tax=uncultured Lactobacillus sp. TaxID=153152 RepID=A0A060BUH7_9LACO|nr:CAZy families GH32 protein [uncultured Lactobacillus sp.]
MTYVYRKNPVAGATVTVKYIDTQGNSISDSIPLSGNVDQEYTTEQKLFRATLLRSSRK